MFELRFRYRERQHITRSHIPRGIVNPWPQIGHGRENNRAPAMPACEVTNVDVAIWNALEAGDFTRARALPNRLIPLLNIEWPYGTAV